MGQIECRARCKSAPTLADVHSEECIIPQNMYMYLKQNDFPFCIVKWTVLCLTVLYITYIGN